MSAPAISRSPAEVLLEDLLWRAWMFEQLGRQADESDVNGSMITGFTGFRRDLKDIVRRAVAAGVLDELHPLTVEFDDEEAP